MWANTPETLYVVATPIGNLGDITYRSVDVLKSCDYVFAEDTRDASFLLKHLGIDKPIISYRDQNHLKILNKIEQFLKEGKSICLVSDSGTPTISDPGFKLVKDLKEKNFKVVPIPGSSAVITALSASGLPTDKFTFVGFLPKTTNQRKNILKTYGSLESTLIIYESPFRLIKLLEEVEILLGNRVICIASELTKLNESIKTGFVNNLLNELKDKKIKGEYVVLVAKEGFKYE